jgi:hypothetical protein
VQSRRRAVAEVDAQISLFLVLYPGKVFSSGCVESVGLGWEEFHQGVMRCLANRCINRDGSFARLNACVTLVASENGIHRVEHRDMDHCHRPAGATRPELFAGMPVVKPSRVNRDLVPPMQGVEALFWPWLRAKKGLGNSLEARPESVIVADSRGSRQTGEG